MAVLPPPEQRTMPRQLGTDGIDPGSLAAGRYGTREMVETFGPEKTFRFILEVQAVSAQVLRDLYPDVVPPEDARVLADTADLDTISPARIRELEAKTGHDIVAVNKAWEEVVLRSERPQAAAHINKIKTSADSTEAAKALQLKYALRVLAESVENLRDISLERALEWNDTTNMELTHLLDMVPAVAGRPFAHYAEMLQSGLGFLRYVYDNSIKGKWSDATGNYHSACDMGLDGKKIEDEFCRRLGIGSMMASAQIPGREYVMDVYYTLERIAETMANMARYIRFGRGSDANFFKYPVGKTGSSFAPHKTLFGGNPAYEEQEKSFTNFMRGLLSGAASACEMDYARDLTGSAFDRMGLDAGFKTIDHVTRRMAEVMHELILDRERCNERVCRSYGVITSPRFLAYLTDTRHAGAMPRSEAHDLLGRLATQAYQGRTPFAEVLIADPAVSARMTREKIFELANPEGYIGESRRIVEAVYDAFHGRRTFPLAA